MTYIELQKILDKEGIGTNELQEVIHHVMPTEKWDEIIGYSLIIRDSALFLFHLKERIDYILNINDIKANVEVDEEKEVLTIKLEN